MNQRPEITIRDVTGVAVEAAITEKIRQTTGIKSLPQLSDSHNSFDCLHEYKLLLIAWVTRVSRKLIPLCVEKLVTKVMNQ